MCVRGDGDKEDVTGLYWILVSNSGRAGGNCVPFTRRRCARDADELSKGVVVVDEY